MHTAAGALPPAERDDETSLVARAAAGDPGAVRAIMQRYNRRLFRMARSILRNDAEAEDAVQSAYVKAFQALDSFQGASSFGTWLTRIAINEALAIARSRKPEIQWNGRDQALMRGRVVPFPVASTSVDPERTMAQREVQAALEQAIDALPEGFRMVLVARVLEEMSVDETADLLGLRPETVKTRLHRARSLLRRGVEERIGPLLLDAFPFAGRRCDRITEEVIRRVNLSPA